MAGWREGECGLGCGGQGMEAVRHGRSFAWSQLPT